MRLVLFLLMISFIGNVVLLSSKFAKANINNQPTQIKILADKNTRNMTEIGFVFEKMFENTGIMMRYSHYLDKHDPSATGPVPFCPECTNAKDEIIPMESSSIAEDVDLTFDQLFKDADEMHDSIYIIKSSLYNQGIKLKHTLKQLKELK